MNRIIIYEKLNILTLSLSLLNRFFYKQQYFINYSLFVKNHCHSLVKIIPILQIHYVNLPGSGALQKGSKMAIELGNEIVNDNQKLSMPFVKYLNDPRAVNLIKKIYINTLINNCIKYNVLKEFVERNEDTDIYYFSDGKTLIVEFLRKEAPHVVVIRWHIIFLSSIYLISKIIKYILLVMAPLLITARIIKEGRFSFHSKEKKKVSKEIVFFHRTHFIRYDNVNIYRDLYFFHSSILKISDCIHSGTFTRLSDEKSTYLKDKGGLVCDYMSEKIPARFIAARLFIDYYKCFFRSFFALAFNRFSSRSTIIGIVGVLDKTIMLQNLLSIIDAKLAFFESEMLSVCSIFTIVADRYGIKTITMSHGAGAYCAPDEGRTNMVVNYYLVQGNYYKKYFLPDNPDIDNYYLTGDIEIEPILSNKERLCKDLRIRRDKRIVTVFVMLSMFLPNSTSSFHKLLGGLFDQEDARKALERLWRPFLEWADSQNDIFFIFKGKKTVNQYEHPFMKELLSVISPEKYYQNDEFLAKDLIAISDCTISTENSSTFYSSLCLGNPAISYNFTMPGYVPVVEYDRHLVATNPEELIYNLTHILKFGISNEVFKKVRKDHYAEGNLDFKAAERIKKLTKKIISN